MNNNRQLLNQDILEMPFFKYRNNNDIQNLLKSKSYSRDNSKCNKSETSRSFLRKQGSTYSKKDSNNPILKKLSK